MRLSQLVVDECVVEAGVGRVCRNPGVENPRRPRPVDRANTHGAGLAGGVEFAAFQLKFVECAASFTNGDDFGVRRRIIRRRYAVRAFGNDVPIFDHDAAERAATRADIFESERDGAANEFCRHVQSGRIQIASGGAKAQCVRDEIGRTNRFGGCEVRIGVLSGLYDESGMHVAHLIAWILRRTARNGCATVRRFERRTQRYITGKCWHCSTGKYLWLTQALGGSGRAGVPVLLARNEIGGTM